MQKIMFRSVKIDNTVKSIVATVVILYSTDQIYRSNQFAASTSLGGMDDGCGVAIMQYAV